MSSIDYIAIFIIFALAAMLGYFLNRALQGAKIQSLEDQVEQDKLLKNEFAATQRTLAENNIKVDKLVEDNERIRQDFYQLTLSYKDLQDEFEQKSVEQLEQEYDVPPELPRLRESNKLLAAEIDRLRLKLKKWKAKPLHQENKKLRRKLSNSLNKLVKLRAKKNVSVDTVQYEALYHQIQQLSEEARVLIKEKRNFDSKSQKTKFPKTKPSVNQPSKKKSNKKSAKKIKGSSKKSEDVGIFKNQPESKRRKIFREIIQGFDGKESPTVVEEQAFDLPNDINEDKTLMDLMGIDAKVYAVLLHGGIESFHVLSNMKIKKIKKLLKASSLNPDDYDYSTWPIQASLASKGQWHLIEQYGN